MIRLVIESAYKAGRFSVEANVKFARQVCHYAVTHGYAPYASHLFYTQPDILDDSVQGERMLGINAGLAWAEVAEEVWFCLRPGEELSEGMRYALQRHVAEGKKMQVALFNHYGEFVEFVTDQLDLAEVMG